MPSSDVVEDDVAPAKPKKANTPQRSPAVRRPANATPTRKAPANNAGTPKSAPARTRPGIKKAEPTLFTDFLLGRPSVNRARRKSLDVVPMEMKRSAVSKVQPPGGVKERVKQWQKASAAAVVEDALEPPSEPDDLSLHLDDESVTERDRRNIKFRKNNIRRPSRRKSGDNDNPMTPGKSVSSPRKRVVSDDHWVVDREKETPPRILKIVQEPLSKGQKLPKDFLKNSTNPPLERKIEDWNKRTISDGAGHSNKQARNAPKKGSKNVENKLVRSGPESPDHEIRTRPLKSKPVLDGDAEKPINNLDRHKEIEPGAEDSKSPRRRSGKYRESSLFIKESPPGRNFNSLSIANGDDSNDICRTPTHPPRSKNRHRNSATPESLADIPVGYSAFSVLDISVGGDAATTRPSKPQRQPSLSAVPKALKKVYTESLKKVHGAVDPPRLGVNQPPSIESWLKGTSDPFVDELPESESVLGISQPRPRNRSYGKENLYQKDSTPENDHQSISTTEQPSKGMQTSQDNLKEASSSRHVEEIPGSARVYSERKVSARAMQHLPPAEIKRSPAVRHASPPQSTRQTPPRDIVLVDSHSGQVRSGPRGRSPSLSTKGSELCYETGKAIEGAIWGPKGRDHAHDDNTQETSSSRSSQTGYASCLRLGVIPDHQSCKAYNKRNPISTGQRRLSTIASVETFETSSSLTETFSVLSDTTVTQTTVTENMSRTSYTSNASCMGDRVSSQRGNDLGLKRRLTKHSDLLSVLSLPDTSVSGRTKSIRSARSIRTNRTRLDSATITDLLQELAEDEVKYMRELKTLVDGVIPVLLSSVLSKPNSTVAVGLFGQNSSGQTDAFITKPIVDMGIALEQLKTLHKRIPLHDSESLLHWALSARKVYEDYADAWRMGFQNVVVNLAPAPQSNSVADHLLDGMPRNEDGDVLNENGERVDVAFLLKRPLARVKYLAKVMKGIHTFKPREQAAKVDDQYQNLLTKIRRRTREEEARLEDQAAFSTDATRARDPRTLGPLENVTIDRTRQVYAKDFFDFGLSHSSGQRVDCRVELLFRDQPHDKSDAGDVLICEVDSISRWLLFPPVELDRISARAGETTRELVVMIRGTDSSKAWHELLTLKSADDETASEWIQMLGSTPRPPDLQHIHAPPAPIVSFLLPTKSTEDHKIASNSTKSTTPSGHVETDVPIGERRGKYERLRAPKTHDGEQRVTIANSPPISSQGNSRAKGGNMNLPEDEPKDLNDAMGRAGRLVGSDLRRTKAKRYHSYGIIQPPVSPPPEHSARSNDANSHHESDSMPSPGHSSAASAFKDSHSTYARTHPSELPSAEIPPSLERRKISQHVINEDKSLHLKDSTVPGESFKMTRASSPAKQVWEEKDEAPPPPPHKSSSSILLKSSPVLAKPISTPKNRRSSSPLKHEYQPSCTSDTSSASDESDSGDFGHSSDSSEEELEAVDPPTLPPDSGRPRNKISPPGSLYILPSASLAPSNSASQALYHGSRPESKIKTTKLVATISCWSDKGRWVDLHPQDCSVVVGPGLIEAYAMSVYLSSEVTGSDHVSSSSSSSEAKSDKDDGVAPPLVSLELTPIVPLRQSNALDIEIRSPPTAKSSVECTHTVRFRSRTLQECTTLYAAIHKARMENPVYMKLEQERIINAYGKQLLEESTGGNHRRSWFGRSKSYRASTRAPSETVSESSANSIASAISRLRSLGIFGSFNIDKSTVGASQSNPSGTSSGATSVYTGSTNSASSRTTPPRSSSSPSSAMMGTSNAISFGSNDLRIRLYLNVTPSKWSDFGSAFLTITHPTRGMRQASSLYHGVEKRIIVTRNKSAKRTLSEKIQGSGSPKDEEPGALQVVLDVVLGGACFSRQGVVGIVMNVWEDIRGDNGEVGKVAAIGGVSGRTRRWMFHFASAAETAWVFSLVGGGVR